jgi:uncharacterized protein (TIGR02246 family)
MKTIASLCLGFACALQAFGDEPSPEFIGLQKAAADFVTAYNNQNSSAIAELFTEDGEMIELGGDVIVSGRDAIKERYDEIFSREPLQIAIEATSVRLVAPHLAIEDGTFHLTPADDEGIPPRSTSYTAVLTKDPSGSWLVASTRSLKDVTSPAGQLAGLADLLAGEWTSRDSDGVRLDLAFGWDAAGTAIIGEMLTSTADSEPQAGSIRIAWDAAQKQVVSWMFDAKGGFTHGVWTPSEEGWLIRSEGSSADGESISASQRLTRDGVATLIWAASQRTVDGVAAPDRTLRIVRQAPDPAED